MVKPNGMGTSPDWPGDPKWAPAQQNGKMIDLGYRLCLRPVHLERPPRCQRGDTPPLGLHPPLPGPACGPLCTSLRGAGVSSLQGHQPPLGITLAAQLQLGTHRDGQ
jgi:hypothetical protein